VIWAPKSANFPPTCAPMPTSRSPSMSLNEAEMPPTANAPNWLALIETVGWPTPSSLRPLL
jgi:hypothetical protein